MKYVYAFFCALLFTLPTSASAAVDTQLEVTGWIPYWRVATGTTDTLPHLDKLTEVNPFVSLSKCGKVSAVPVAVRQYGIQPVTSSFVSEAAEAGSGSVKSSAHKKASEYLIPI